MIISLVGCGTLGRVLAHALAGAHTKPIDTSETYLHLVDRNSDGVRPLAFELGATFETCAGPRVASADVVILAVRPQEFAQAGTELAPYIHAGQLLISVMAGIPISRIAHALPGSSQIVRVMPNLPAQVRQAVTALVAGPGTSAQSLALARALFASVGETIVLEREELIDAVTAVSGSGPGYIYYFAQALFDAALKLGLPEPEAETFVRETFRGTVTMWCRGSESLRQLRDSIATKGGGTEAAFDLFETEHMPERLRAGVEAAWRRYRELSAG